MGRDSTGIDSPPFTGDDILGLLDTLRRDGFAIGMDEYLNAQEVLSACARYDLNTKDSLRNWLSPVLCTNAEEQRLFYQRFETWWNSLTPAEPEPVPEKSIGRTRFDDEVEKLGWNFWLPLVATATLALVAGWFAIRSLLDVPSLNLDECQQELPQLANLQEENARLAIGGAGLEVGNVVYTKSETTDKGHVVHAVWQVDTEPACRIVSITVSEGSAEPVMPDPEIKVVLHNYELRVHGRVLDHKDNPISGARVIVAPDRYFSGATEQPDNAAAIVDDRTSTTDEGLPYLEDFRALGEADIILPGYEDRLRSAAFSPDGSRIVTASEDGTVRVWNSDGSGEPSILQGHKDDVLSATFSPDGSRIATASWDETARVWNADGSGEPLILRGHEDDVWAATFSLDGSRIVTASEDGTARVWNADGSGEPLILRGQQDDVVNASFSPDGSRIVTASGDGTAHVWNADGSGEPLILRGHEDVVWSATFSPDGLHIVTASEDGTAHVWNADGSGEPLILRGHEGSVWSATFSPDGSRIVTASSDRTARIWNADGSGEPLILKGHKAIVWSATFSPDGSQIVTASSDGTARVWRKGNILDTQHWTETDADGNFELIPEFFDGGALVVSHDDYKTALQLGRLSDPGTFQFETELIPRAPAWLRTMERFIFWATFTLISLVFVLAVYRWFRNRRLREIVLEHRVERNVKSVAEVNIAEPSHELYHGADFIHARSVAYRREQSESDRLDEAATVDETVRRLGHFTPVYQTRVHLPNYLALIDRASFDDQQASLVGTFIDRLTEGGVSVDRYFFDRDPRVCASGQDTGARHRSLRELAARYPAYRLLIFSDGQGLAHPFAGGLARWIGLLDDWPERVLMTPVPAYHWSRRELELTATGLLVLPATSAGLQQFVEHVTQTSVATELPGNWSPAFPEIIELHPTRWMEREAPPEDDQAEMLRQLRGYLGNDTYRWLSALAVYPELKWYITLYLGLELKRESGDPLMDEAALLNLTRLPWLRHGVMPDWLREQLIASLSAEDEQAIRSFLYRLLRNPLEDQQSRLQLNIARSGEKRKLGRWSQVFRQILVSEPDDSPLQDAVFVEFLSGKRRGRLQFLVPQKWHRLLFNNGVRALGLKPSVEGVLAAALCAGVLSVGIVLHAAAGQLFAPKDTSKITEIKRELDDSVLDRFEEQSPGFVIGENGRISFSMDGHGTHRCLRECEARECVAAEVIEGRSCRLFAAYDRMTTTRRPDVRLFLASRTPEPPGPDEVSDSFPMPDVVGLTIARAERSVVSAGRDSRVSSANANIVGRRADTRPAGQIIQQLDAAGKQMRPYPHDVGGTYGEVIFRVVVSTGEERTDPPFATSFSMPNVLGLTVVEAERRVLSAGRNSRVTSAKANIVSRQADTRPAGQIIEQSPASGTQMRPYLDDVGGTYGEVSFRVMVTSGEEPDDIEPLDEYLANQLRNSVAVVRSSSGVQGAESLSRYFVMEESPTQQTDNRVSYDQATAFFVSTDGLMMTTILPPGSSSVTVQLPNDRSGVPVFSVLASREFNLEAIAIEDFSGRVNILDLDGPGPERAALVHLLGYALNSEWRLLSGRVTGRAELPSSQGGFVTSIDYQDGLSGAPVVDQKGRLVGVAQSGDTSGKVIIIPVEQVAYFRKEVQRALRDLAE